MELLGIDISSLREPVLDIGCGSEGAIVRYLKETGIDVYGVDRCAPLKPPFIRKDWFDIAFPPEYWGTVIAHHSLSTHSLYCHVHEPVNAEHYARLYMDILYSLKPGGLFYYAPGVPFLEKLVKKTGNYAVSTTYISLPVHDVSMHDISYAVRVIKAED